MVRVKAAHLLPRRSGRRDAWGRRARGASLRHPCTAHKRAESSLILCIISAILALACLAPVASAQATTIFSDDFEVGFSGWTLSGSGAANWYTGVPRNGTHSIQLTWARRMERTISTACYQNIAVSFYMGANSLEGSDYVRASWYDGSAWQPLKQINNGDREENNALWPFTYALPAGAANAPNFALQFEVSGNNNQDYGYVDDVVVQGDLIQYSLDLTGVGNGQVRVNGTLRSPPWSGTFGCGSAVNLQAVPDAGWQFDNWSGGLSGSANPTTITMDGSKAVTANFSQIQYTLSLTGVGNGQVRVNGTLRSLPWSGNFVWGSVVNLQAVPDACYQFDNWSGDLSGSASPTNITMNGNKAVTASFSEIQYTLSLTGAGNGQVRVNGTLRSLPWSGSFACGSSVNLEAVPDGGWQFDNWSGALSGSINPTTITMDGNKSVTANFSQIQYTLSLTGVGNGQVRVNGVLRALPWSESFVIGSVVNLQAVPDAGWQFDNWSGDLSGSTNPTTIPMDGNKSVTASFSQIQYTLSLTGVGNGQVRVNGVLRALPWSGNFVSGSVVSLEAVPDAGWQFGNWSGDLSGSANPDSITMDGNKAVTANFTQIQYSLSLVGVGNGSVRVNGTLRALPWSGNFASGSVVDLEAVPASGWQFDNWSGDLSGSGNPTTLTMGGNKSVTASFSQIQYTLSLTGVGTGSVRVNGTLQALPWSGVFLSGSVVDLEAVPGGGSWQFDNWSGDLTGSTNPTTIAMDSDKAVTANFSLVDYTLSLSGVGSGQVRVNGTLRVLPWSGMFVIGSVVNLEAVPASGWQFDNWSGDLIGGTNPDAITVDGSKSVTAHFSEIQYALSLTGVGNGQVRVNGTLRTLPWSGSFVTGTVVNLQAVPDSGWQFDNWSGELSGSANPTTITMDGNKSVTANFSLIQYALSLTGVGNGQVRVNGTLRALPWSSSFPSGTVVDLQAVPDAGWQFDNWSGDLSGSATPTAITMDGAKAVTATFSRVQYTLNLTGVGSGSARVDGTPHALPWSDSFVSGTSVTVEAVAASGWSFLNWSGSVTSSEVTIVVVMDGNKTITANFTQQRVLRITGVGTGSVRVNGTIRALPWSGAFATGTVVTLEAVPDSGWEFDGWTGDRNWPTELLIITLDSDITLVANFSSSGVFHTLSLSGVGNGSVLVNGTLRALPWSGSFAAGAQVTLEAVPDPDWFFLGWSGGASGTTNPIVVTMDRDRSITASFTWELREIGVSALGRGTVKLNGATLSLPYSGTVAYGSDITLEAIADYGWRFADWSGSIIAVENPVVVTVDDDLDIVANFIFPERYFLTISKTGAGSVSVNGAIVELPWTGEFARGEEVRLEAKIEGEQEFYGWSGDAGGTTRTIILLMDADKQVTAEFMCIATFPDVPCDYWCHDAIEAVRTYDIVEGYRDGLYRPRLIVDRGAMAVYVSRGLSGGKTHVPAGPAEPSFPDVPADFWAYDAVEYAVANNVVQGYLDGKYHADWDVTRGQMAVFIARAIATPTGEAGLVDYEPPATPTFGDVATTYWSYKHIEYLAEHGVVRGYLDGYYRPAWYVTRDQMAVYIARAFELPT